MAIRIENNGESVYRDAIAKVSQPELISSLNWMADEEAKHAKWFANLKKEFSSDKSNPFVEEMSRELFNDLLGEKNFSHQELDFSKISSLKELFDIFIEFERDTVLFYEMLQPFIEKEDTLIHLNKIIAEEKNHIAHLQELIRSKAALSADAD
jgi:rubrerythrin